MNWIERWHESRIHGRRVRVLAEAIARLLPPDCRVLDIGCGDGLLATSVRRLRPDVEISGAEVLPRQGCRIPVTAFDGTHLPFAEGSFDAALLIDVLHHTDSPPVLLREAKRVAGTVLLKDHFRQGFAAQSTLRLMDRVGNCRHGVPLPHTYLSPDEWQRVFLECGLAVESSDSLRDLYAWPMRLIAGRRLHFLARLRPISSTSLAPAP